jgi:integrating conjugative element protein (TIGR03749 family)
VSAALAERLRVQSAGGAIYLKANAPIDISRLQLQDADSGALILLDVTATTAKDGQPPLEPMRIVEDSGAASSVGDNGRSDPTVIESTEAPSNMKPNRATPLPVVLTRYAAQNLYAPLRTVEPVAGVASANLQIGMPLDTLMPSVPLRAAAMAAWRLDDFWVTAVKITNATSSWMALDPRTIQGDFVAATFQHPDVGPQGTPFDTTIVYLVTRGHGLAESLLPHISRIDAAKDLPGTDKHGVDMGDHHEE